MTKLVSIHQPAYLPWLGYFDKIACSDLFVYLDTVQFQKNSFQNRNKIRVKDGWTWLTVPVLTKGQLFSRPLSEITINNNTVWRKKHLQALRMNYRRAPFYDREMPYLEKCLDQEWEVLSDLCFTMLEHFLHRLDITTNIIKASALPPMDSAKSTLILNLCQEVGASDYLSGALGSNYLDIGSFAEAGIAIEYQDYEHPEYSQSYSGFEPYMGVIDLLMNDANPASLLKRHSR
jgi:hypothetical protein